MISQKLRDAYQALYDKHGEIQIKCQAATELPIDAIRDFQGGLKRISTENKIRLATRMFKSGFCAPFFVWDNAGDYCCMDGHQRSTVLCELRACGIAIPGLFPVAYVQAASEAEAREMLLSISSQYGDWAEEELKTWLAELDNEISKDIRLMQETIDLDNGESEGELKKISFLVTRDQYDEIHKRVIEAKQENGFRRNGDALFLLVINDKN